MADDADRPGDVDRAERLERLYAACRALPAAEREAYLDAHCPEADLRAEIESLLAAAADAGSFLDLLARGWQQGGEDLLVDRLNAALSGRYRVEAEIGRGGMATVYRVHDLRHDRPAALKLLRPALSVLIGTERFLREIRTTASLQHPHILPLFDSGAVDGFLYYVMPFVEGESLRDLLRRHRQLPVEDAVRITTRVASALAYAHDVGIIHRDIKPENILVSSGEPLVADFGIAVAAGAALSEQRLTETGFSPGTPQYMSPEQVTGESEVGPATDVYALGCVLHEMLIGEPPHDGRTHQAILGSILADDAVRVSDRRASVPPNVDAAVRKALQKLPADRFTSAGAFADALEDPNFRFGGDPSVPARERGRPSRVLIALCVLLTATTLWAWLGRQPVTPEPAVTRTSINLDGDHRIHVARFESLPLAVSADGTAVAYVGESMDGTRLYLRRLDAEEPALLQGTEDARQPFFSPDGAWIAFFAGGDLLRVSVDGGAPIVIAPLPLQASGIPEYTSGGAWGPDGWIVFVAGDRLWRVRMGGTPEPVPVGVVAGEGVERESNALPARAAAARVDFPSFLPPRRGDDGDPTVLLTLDNELAAVSVATGSATLLGVRLNGHARFVPPGYILFTLSTGVARAVRFDPETREVRGTPVPVLDDVFRGVISTATFLAVSETGTLAYVPGGSQRRLLRVDRLGRETELPLPPSVYRFPSVSPDGSRLVVADSRQASLLLVDLNSGAVSQLVRGTNAIWSPAGDRIAFSSSQQPLMMPAVPGSAPEGLFGGTMPPYPTGWGDDGRIILYNAPRGNGDIFIAALGARVPDTVIASPWDEREPARSHDGRFVAYTSDVSGRNEVYVRDLSAAGEAVQVSINGGRSPLWARDRRELFYWKAERVLSSQVLQDRPLRLSTPAPLFTGRYMLGGPNWDVFPSGDFVVVAAGPNWLREIKVIQHFTEELKRLAGPDGPPP